MIRPLRSGEELQRYDAGGFVAPGIAVRTRRTGRRLPSVRTTAGRDGHVLADHRSRTVPRDAVRDAEPG